jgi:hypothetical protein
MSETRLCLTRPSSNCILARPAPKSSGNRLKVFWVMDEALLADLAPLGQDTLAPSMAGRGVSASGY